MKKNQEVFVVDAVRTPAGRFGGKLKDVSAVELGVVVVKTLLQRSGIAPTAVEEVIMGNGWQAGAGPNPARLITVKAGLPDTVPATTINVRCGSSLKSLMLGAQAILLGDRDVVLVGGTESTSRVPYALPAARWGYRMGDKTAVDLIPHDGFNCPLAGMLMGATADVLARRYSISRAEQDEFALESQRKAARAIEEGLFSDELVPVPTADGELSADETVRPNTTLEGLAKLPPVFNKDGTVTAGNACAMADGASAALLASASAVKRLGLRPLASVLSFAHTGVDPRYMGLGPVAAVPAALERAGLSLADIEVIEANEAFAAQVLAVQRELQWNTELVNLHGGAVALGHPVGATGTKLVATLLHALRRYGKRYGLVNLCVGGGQGMAVVFESTGSA